MAKDPLGHNIYSDDKRKVIFQNPNESLEKFDYINKFEEDSGGANKGIFGLTPQFGVRILEKIIKFFKGIIKKGTESDRDF